MPLRLAMHSKSSLDNESLRNNCGSAWRSRCDRNSPVFMQRMDDKNGASTNHQPRAAPCADLRRASLNTVLPIHAPWVATFLRCVWGPTQQQALHQPALRAHSHININDWYCSKAGAITPFLTSSHNPPQPRSHPTTPHTQPARWPSSQPHMMTCGWKPSPKPNSRPRAPAG